jgi:hypothetical protein
VFSLENFVFSLETAVFSLWDFLFSGEKRHKTYKRNRLLALGENRRAFADVNRL